MGLLGLGIGGGGSGGSIPFSSLTNIVVPKTVAQMQTLGGASGFTAGQIYQITDAYSNTAVINIKAFSTSVLEDYGFGTFQNAVMSVSVKCFVWYDLGTDKIARVYDPAKNNDVKGDISASTALDTFRFDAALYKNNVIDNCAFTADVGCTLNGNYFCNGSSSNIVGFNHSLTNCRIGAGKTFDLAAFGAAYTSVGAFYDGDTSTFEVTGAENSQVNPAAGTIEMISFPWAGILRFTAGGNVDTFSTFPTDHSWILVSGVSVSNATVRDATISGGNIYLEVDSSSIIINRNIIPGDFLEFKAGSILGVQKIGGYIRS